jgi:hypothetical protein
LAAILVGVSVQGFLTILFMNHIMNQNQK